jgi:hypothetical protein
MTKGKWIVKQEGPAKHYVIYAERDMACINPLFSSYVSNPNGKDDAQAISALPDLIEALKEVYYLLPNSKPSEQVDVLHRVSVALNRAGVFNELQKAGEEVEG